MASAKGPTNHANSPLLQHAENSGGAETIDRVAEAAAESFPASDPPGWTPLTAGPPAREEAREGECVSYEWPPPPSEEPDALLDTLQRLEAALATASPGQDQEWTARTRDELREIQEILGRYAASDKGPDRFLADVHLAPGAVRRSCQLHQEHDDLLLLARMLLVMLGHEEEAADCSTIRRRIDLLVQGLHQFEGLEKDLIFEGLCTDIGTAD